MSRSIDLIVVHCSATTPTMDWRAADIDRAHRQRGWSRIGYHYVIPRDGTLEPGRAESDVGAHVQGHNRTSLGVCLIGGVAKDGRTLEANYTELQWSALRRLLLELRARYPHAVICGHRDLSPDKDGDGVIERHEWVKGCPSFDVGTWLVLNGLA
jgi:N-acetylmuramoyl-L-alanine amidase